MVLYHSPVFPTKARDKLFPHWGVEDEELFWNESDILNMKTFSSYVREVIFCRKNNYGRVLVKAQYLYRYTSLPTEKWINKYMVYEESKMGGVGKTEKVFMLRHYVYETRV